MRRWHRLPVGWAIGAALGSALLAQDLRFDVASIKLLPELETKPAPVASPDRLYLRNVRLTGLVSHAAELPLDRVVGGPAWARTDRWEVSAKARGAASEAEKRRMLMALLEERFSLKIRREFRSMPVFELVLARADRRLGPGLRVASGGCRPFHDGQRGAMSGPRDANGVPDCINSQLNFAGRTVVRLNDVTIASFALKNLEPVMRQPVIDKTGLTGDFDIAFDFVRPGPANLTARRGDVPELPTALREELGLRLRQSKAEVEVVVIDSAEQPTPD